MEGEPVSRFEPPQELEFSFTPPERQEIRNNNIPLTVGLLFSIVASFVVFFISLAGGTSGSDPVMPSFWRGLGALAVLTTLSFAASWFMPAPVDRRRLLDQIEAEEQLTADRQPRAPRRQAAPEAPQPEASEPEPSKGSSIDLRVADDGFDTDSLFNDEEDEEETDLDDEDDEDFSPPPAAAQAPVRAEAR